MTIRPFRALVLQHLPVEHPGAIGSRLRQAGLELTVVELDHGDPIPDLGGFDLMLVMGGPMDVWQGADHPWLADEKAAIRRWVRERRRPYLGICLGHQLLADALGGEVGPMASPEVGVVPVEVTPVGASDILVGALEPPILGLQWHGAQVTRLPHGAVALATNGACAVQALRVGDMAWGLQFHAEVGPDTVAEWAAVPEYRRALVDVGTDSMSLAAAVERHLVSLDALSATLTRRLVGAVGRCAARSGDRIGTGVR